jgi:hypothetical protein
LEIVEFSNYYIFNKLAWDGINVFEVVSTSNEITILLKDKDVDRAFTVIKQIKGIKPQGKP